MKLSRTVSYALQATLHLAQQSDAVPIPCSRLAAVGEMPERFLLQILRNLVTHGILRSTRGVEGGYSLLRPATEISVLDVIEAIDGPMDVEVDAPKGLARQSYEHLCSTLCEITTASRQRLGALKIADLGSQAGP